jgi:amino acid adenylation domain-containing protein
MQKMPATSAEPAPERASALLHESVRLYAEVAPNNLAVIAKDGVLTYAQLLDRSEHIYADLRRRSLEPEALVGVRARRSIETAVRLLGVLRAGCAYLPLDVSQPDLRTRGIVEAARPVVVIPDDCARVAENGIVESSQPPVVDPERLAYVIYTSGSTGTPKGVEITHAGAVSTLRSINHLCGTTASDRIFSVSPAAFDLSVYDVFGAWAVGAAVVLAPEIEFAEPREWACQMADCHVTIWNSAPALLEMLLDLMERDSSLAARALDSLRVVLLSGDRISPRLVHRLVALKPGIRVLALGGATEASIWSVHNFVEALAEDAAYVPYGYALPGQRILVLDSELREVCPGDCGDLYIGGMGLARGYRHRADLTAQAFLPDPYVAGALLYATGDRVRRLTDGNTQFIGRSDQQLKLNGFRVEVSEVENALRQLVGVRQAVVEAELPAEARTLRAWVVLDGESQRSSASLRRELADRLPAYMLPSRIEVIHALPLTPNGKVDRAALLAQTAARAPRTDRTPALASIWQDVLDLQDIDADAHFLDLGGNSVLAAQLANRIASDLGVHLEVRDIFASPTLAALTLRLRAQSAAHAVSVPA